MNTISIKNSGNALLFRQLEAMGCILRKVGRGGRNTAVPHGLGTSGYQGRHTYEYPEGSHKKVISLVYKYEHPNNVYIRKHSNPETERVSI